MSDPVKRTRMSAEDRRANLLDAARTVFLRHGYAGARTKDIAKEAGVTEPVLYQHFESKEALFQAAILEPLEDLVEELAATSEHIDTTLDREALLAEGIGLHEHRARVMLDIAPLWAVMLFEGETGRRFYRERLAPLIDRYAEALGRLMGSRNMDLDPGVLGLALLGMYGWIAFDALARGVDLDTNYVARQLAPLLVNFSIQSSGSG